MAREVIAWSLDTEVIKIIHDRCPEDAIESRFVERLLKKVLNIK